MKKTMTPAQVSLLVLMSSRVFDNPEVDLCAALLRERQKSKMSEKELANLRDLLESVREFARHMQRFVKKLHARRPWPDRIKWPKRRKEAFRKRLAAYCDQDGQPRKSLSDEEKVALGLLHWTLSQPTLPEKRARATNPDMFY